MLNYKSKRTAEEILGKIKTTPYNIEGKYLENSNNFIFGDNIYGLNYLVNDCNLKGKIDLVYIDPPFNTNQNFMTSGTRNNSISKSEDGIIAYKDNLSKEQYFEFIRERLIIIKELMSENGSIYFHIDYKIGHYIKVLMDEIFGESNFKNDITRIKSNPKNFFRKAYGNEKDMILFYAKNKDKNIWNDIRMPMDSENLIKRYPKVDESGRRYTTIPLHAPGETKNGLTGQEWRGMLPPKGRHWRTSPEEFDILDSQGLIEWSKTGNPRIKKFADEHKGVRTQDIWKFKDPQNPQYPTQKNLEMLKFIVKQSSNNDSIVLDCFAGGGTTLAAAELEGRRWIGIDNSEVSFDRIRTNPIFKCNYIIIKD